MHEIQLNIFSKIIGIGASSGLISYKNHLYIISDSSSFLYDYNISNQILYKIPLVENAKENIAKPEKLDLESICLFGNELFILGSGSMSNRCNMFIYDLNIKKVISINQSKLFQRIVNELSIPFSELNIEGLIIQQDYWLLFQRGNGEQAINGIIKYRLDNKHLEFIKINLPKINNVTSSFTDAILHQETIYFLASAEDSASTYHDGEVMGTLIGSLEAKTFELINYQIVSYEHKFEGLTLESVHDKQITFLLCEDTDSEIMESKIYELKMTIN